MSSDQETYIGDGVYAHFDGYHIWLTTRDRVHSTNAIALEPEVYFALIRYATKTWNLSGVAGDTTETDYAHVTRSANDEL